MIRGRSVAQGALAGIVLLLAACEGSPVADEDNAEERRESAAPFPEADRPVAPVVSIRYAGEAVRDRAGEAQAVMDAAGVTRGMTVADLGAGEGYYTVRLARRVGPEGHVTAQDIMAEVVEALARRVRRLGMGNVDVRRGTPDNPKLPHERFDRILMVHMYHEIEEPYAFLWNLRPALKRGGEVVVVDALRPIEQHGTPPRLLACEFAAVGYRLIGLETKTVMGGYVARFRADGPGPAPESITPCTAAGKRG